MMSDFLRRNLTIKLMSLAAAVLLWLYVTNTEAPIEQTTRSVKLDIQQLKSDFDLVDKPDTVKIRLQGTKNALSNLGSKDIVAFADLSDAKAGVNNLLVQVKVPNNIRVLQTTPTRVNITLDTIDEKSIPVKIRTRGNLSSGYLLDQLRANPASVTVRGPGRYLRQLGSVYVDLDVSESQHSLNVSLPVKLSAKNINEAAIEVRPREVQVIATVSQDIQTKTVSLKPVVTGQPANGFQQGTVIVTPDQITISGPKAKLSNLDFINVEPLDITGLNSNVTKTVKILLPDEVTAGGAVTAQVQVQIVPKPGNNAGT